MSQPSNLVAGPTATIDLFNRILTELHALINYIDASPPPRVFQDVISITKDYSASFNYIGPLVKLIDAAEKLYFQRRLPFHVLIHVWKVHKRLYVHKYYDIY